MSRYFCHDHPDVLTLETRVVDARPGAVVLASSPFHPGGGGQLADRGRLVWDAGEASVVGFETAADRVWHLLDAPVEPRGGVQVTLDADFRAAQTELHTGAHILNALVYRHFNGALITGAQLGDDLTARVDFDLPAVENDRVRALEAEINDVIRQDLPVRDAWLPLERVRAPRMPEPFARGARVEVEWKKKWYPATVLRAESGLHHIHYDGYDASWDEWVSSGRIRKAR